MTTWLLSLAAAVGLVGSPGLESFREKPGAVFREDFVDLTLWRAWEFDKVDRSTQYEIHEDAGDFFLRMDADRSASGLILTQNFPVNEDVKTD